MYPDVIKDLIYEYLIPDFADSYECGRLGLMFLEIKYKGNFNEGLIDGGYVPKIRKYYIKYVVKQDDVKLYASIINPPMSYVRRFITLYDSVNILRYIYQDGESIDLYNGGSHWNYLASATKCYKFLLSKNPDYTPTLDFLTEICRCANKELFDLYKDTFSNLKSTTIQSIIASACDSDNVDFVKYIEKIIRFDPTFLTQRALPFKKNMCEYLLTKYPVDMVARLYLNNLSVYHLYYKKYNDHVRWRMDAIINSCKYHINDLLDYANYEEIDDIMASIDITDMDREIPYNDKYLNYLEILKNKPYPEKWKYIDVNRFAISTGLLPYVTDHQIRKDPVFINNPNNLLTQKHRNLVRKFSERISVLKSINN